MTHSVSRIGSGGELEILTPEQVAAIENGGGVCESCAFYAAHGVDTSDCLSCGGSGVVEPDIDCE